jgi:HlyD family type I secretion membrane fusion protein
VEERIGEVDLRIIELEKKRVEENNAQMQQVQNDIFDTVETLRAARNTLERTDILAPQDGTVVGLSVHTVGGVIQSGKPILDIVPRGDVLVVEANVQPQDIDIVHEGLDAEVLLTAFNRRNTPALPGKVTRVSAYSFGDDSGAFYRIRVEIDPQHTSDLQLYPGMPAEVYLLVGKQTALDYVLKPIEASLRRGLLEE